MASTQDTTPTPGAASATIPRSTGTCHACYRYGYASLAKQSDNRWLCRECEAEAQHIAAGGTVVTVPCPTCSDPHRTHVSTRQRCPACNGRGTVRRLVAPAPEPGRFANLADDVRELLAASEARMPPMADYRDGQGHCVATAQRIARERQAVRS